MVQTVKRSALVSYTPEQMYRVVNDIDNYPRFIPWCVGSEVLMRNDDYLIARLDMSRNGMSQSFTTRNVLTPPESMQMELVDGPFSQFSGRWDLQPLGDAGCKISMRLDFEFANFFMNATFGPMFASAADSMVEAFCSRADQLHGG